MKVERTLTVNNSTSFLPSFLEDKKKKKKEIQDPERLKQCKEPQD